MGSTLLYDFAVGFFLYFVTAVDYALIIGRIQAVNSGSKARFIMNVFTCVGCFVGVTLVLFLWGFAKEINWLIFPILIFAGAVMLKLAQENIEYFENSNIIPKFVRVVTAKTLNLGGKIAKPFVFWVPELSTPKAEKMSLTAIAKWSFFLPFIIGVDDLIGYLGAMTIYNVFGLLVGIYTADILIDILIFVSPKLTKKLVENSYISLLASYAFIYLAYKSYSESFHIFMEIF